ncbi:MAG: formyltetrahydrofolate deformylase [Thermaerobacter sp.]|nr:formyltetrahydrofolate deformylase [Thermaerobacter sp.]
MRQRLLIACPDAAGIIRSVATVLHEAGANIVSSDQYSEDPNEGMFFMRTEFDWEPSAGDLQTLQVGLAQVGQRYDMTMRLTRADDRKRLAIFVSRSSHCLHELLWQWQTGEIQADLTVVAGNHPDHQTTVQRLGIPYVYVPMTRDRRQAAEERLWQAAQSSDLIVLARFMQILSPRFVAGWEGRMINIHHSFLPAFVGADPYRQAFARGVKLIGATAHYVTEELDAGPIIEQDVQRVDHSHRVDDLRRIGSHIERQVLARAVRWHLEDRVLVHGGRTVVFRA